MSSNRRLEDVIHQLDSSHLPDVRNTSAKIVMIDVKTGAILSRRPLLGFGKDLRYYLVQHHIRADCEGLVCRIKSFTKKRYLGIRVGYQARCDAGDEEIAVAALYRGEGPTSVLHNLIATWVDEFVREKKEDVIDVAVEFDKLRGEFARFINKKARERVGLTIDTTLEADGEVKSIFLKIDDFAVRVKDCDDELEMSLETELEVDPEKRVLALLSSTEDSPFGDRTKGLIRNWLIENSTLHNFSYDLTGSVKKQLMQEINSYLEGEGRIIKHLKLRNKIVKELPTPESPPENFLEMDHPVECRIRDSLEDVLVQHHLILSLEDFGRYHSSRVTDLKKWVRDTLDQITRTVFFDRSYPEILEGAGPDDIKKEMGQQAGAIGYALKQMTVVPDLEPRTWKDGIEIKVPDETYATLDPRVKVKLYIQASGKIINLRHEGLARYLTPQARDIRVDITASVSTQVEAFLHTIHPARFYMHFDNANASTDKSVKEELDSAIKKLLRERFAFEDVSIILKQRETDLTNRLVELQRKTHSFEVTASPHREGGQREEVTFRFTFNVVRVPESGWYSFLAKKSDTAQEHLQEITDFLREDVKANLDTLPAQFQQFNDTRIAQQLEEKVLSESVRAVMEVFGLEIKFSRLRRMTTDGEEVANEMLREIRAERRDSLATLLDSKRRLIEAGAEEDDEQLMQVQRKIDEIKEEFLPDADKKMPSALPEGEPEFSLEHYKQIQMSPEQYKKQLEEGISGEASEEPMAASSGGVENTSTAESDDS